MARSHRFAGSFAGISAGHLPVVCQRGGANARGGDVTADAIYVLLHAKGTVAVAAAWCWCCRRRGGVAGGKDPGSVCIVKPFRAWCSAARASKHRQATNRGGSQRRIRVGKTLGRVMQRVSENVRSGGVKNGGEGEREGGGRVCVARPPPNLDLATFALWLSRGIPASLSRWHLVRSEAQASVSVRARVPSECDDVIRRAAVSITRRVAGCRTRENTAPTLPEGEEGGSEHPISVLEQIIGC